MRCPGTSARNVCVWLLAGCGRLSFDPVLAHDAVGPDPSAFTCRGPSVADAITISGKTFRYTTFDNQIAIVGSSSVTTTNLSDGTLIGTFSDATGNYSLGLPIAGMPRSLSIQYASGGFMPTTVFFDEPLAADVTGASQALWTPGDGPIWSASAMDSVYAAASIARDSAKSTLNVAVRDCAGNALEGVTVTIDPPPQLALYQAPSGMPSATEMATVAPFTHLIAFNVDATTLHVTASAPGLRFTEATFTVAAGVDAMVVIHGGP